MSQPTCSRCEDPVPCNCLISNTGKHHTQSDIYNFPVDLLNPIIPKEYYRSTGDMLAKTEMLLKDLSKLTSTVKKIKVELTKIKGKNKWLESSIDGDGSILFQIKNPRSFN